MCGVSNMSSGQKVGLPIQTLITNHAPKPEIRSRHVTRSNLIEISPINVIENNRKKSNNKSAVLGKQGINVSNLKHISVDKNDKLKQKWLKCAFINSRSVRNKTIVINDTVVEKDIDLLFLSETWLGKQDDDAVIAALKPDGYDFVHVPRPNKQGGGVAFLHKSQIKLKLQSNKKYQIFECIEALATSNGYTARI